MERGDQLGSCCSNPLRNLVSMKEVTSSSIFMGLENELNSILYKSDVEYKRKEKVWVFRLKTKISVNIVALDCM